MNITPLLLTFFSCVTLLACTFSQAQTTAVGLWQSYDNNTGAPRAEIRITEVQGVLTGRIERNLLPQTATTLQTCERCIDDCKGEPLIGMVLIRNVKKSQELGVWEGGDVLDPDEGKSYRLRLQLEEGGEKLQVRGYVGPFFKNRIWTRIN
jgi:uncharacterized protein (DUF2147 family)